MIKILYLFFCIVTIMSCSPSEKIKKTTLLQPKDFPPSIVSQMGIKQPVKQQPLKLTFAGDIMAHNVNYNMKDYNLIYEDITDILYADDLSFANFETPVNDELPYETYPTFNVQSPYAYAAITAGFDVFSLANNHTNDQGLQGIESTLAFFNSVRQKNIYSAGIKKDSSISYDLIQTQGWTILFVAITELVNSPKDVKEFNMYSFTEKGRATLKQDVTTLQKEYPHDLFILSVHVADAEYITTITDARRKWFYELLDIGVDIVWANHPHVTKEWELIQSADSDTIDKLIMYSIGNTISGQNTPRLRNYEDPSDPMEYTGTSVLLQVDVTQKKILPIKRVDALEETNLTANPTIITTHIDENYNFIIKRLTEDFINSQNKKNADYYFERLNLMKKINGITVCQ